MRTPTTPTTPKHPDLEISPPEWANDKVWHSLLDSVNEGRNIKTWDDERQREYQGVVSSRVGSSGHRYNIVYNHESEASKVDLYEVPFVLLGSGRAKRQPDWYTEDGKFFACITFYPRLSPQPLLLQSFKRHKTFSWEEGQSYI